MRDEECIGESKRPDEQGHSQASAGVSADLWILLWKPKDRTAFPASGSMFPCKGIVND